MKSQDEKLESLLRAGDPADGVAERPVTAQERAAFVRQLVVVPPTTAPPRRAVGLVLVLAAASGISLVLWRSGGETPTPTPQVALVRPTHAPPPTPAPLTPMRSVRSVPPPRRRKPDKPKAVEPESVVTRVVIEADSTCTTALPEEHLLITGDANSVVVVTESSEVSL